MSKREYIFRYNLIINKLRKGGADFNAIVNYLERESEIHGDNLVVSKRTFQRDLDDIRSLFNIDIQYDFSRRVYFIDDAGQPEVNDRILEAFDTFHVLNVSDGLSRYMYFEKRKPAGTENLYGLLHAIKNRLQIKFMYHKFWEDTLGQRSVQPYALKEFRNRWYVLAKDINDDKLKSFALDRLTSLDITRKSFTYPKDLDIEESYRHCFGIISTDQKPEEVVLRFDPFQGKYIKTLPLHHTQSIIIDNDNELVVRLKLCITRDFVMELLSFGNDMRVLEPRSLAERIGKEHQLASSEIPMAYISFT